MSLIGRLNAIDRPAWALFGDFVSLLGILGVAVYVGGYSYIQSYYLAFGLGADGLSGYDHAFSVYVTKVILAGPLSFLLAILLVSFAAFLFMLLNAVFRPWFGYLSLVLLASFITLFNSFVGTVAGNQDAVSNRVGESSILPRVHLIATEDSNFPPRLLELLGRGADLRLLLEKKDSVVVFETLASITDISTRDTYEIKRSELSVIVFQ